MSKKTTKPVRENLSPYLALLDMEVGNQRREPPTRGKGRPKKAFTKKRISLMLAEEEIIWLDTCVSLIEAQLKGNVSRGLLIAFMSARLHAALYASKDQNGMPKLPDSVTSLETLSNYLDELGS